MDNSPHLFKSTFTSAFLLCCMVTSCNSVLFDAKLKVSVQSISFNLNDFYNNFFNTFPWLLEKVQELEVQMGVILAIVKRLLHTIKLGKLIFSSESIFSHKFIFLIVFIYNIRAQQKADSWLFMQSDLFFFICSITAGTRLLDQSRT